MSRSASRTVSPEFGFTCTDFTPEIAAILFSISFLQAGQVKPDRVSVCIDRLNNLDNAPGHSHGTSNIVGAGGGRCKFKNNGFAFCKSINLVG